MAKEKYPISGHYTITEMVGEGLSARVFRAKKKVWGKATPIDLALKVLKPGIDVSIFENELEKLLLVQSKNCVRVLGWEDTDLGPSIALELIDGPTLKELMRCGEVSEVIAKEIVFQLFDAINDLERAGVVHGDISPSNILVTESGDLKLIDFGSLNGENTLGTSRYLSPERWIGGKPLREADVFASVLIYRELFDLEFRRACSENWKERVSKHQSELKGCIQTLVEERASTETCKRDEAKKRLAAKVCDWKLLKSTDWTATRVSAPGVAKSGKRFRFFVTAVFFLLMMTGLFGDSIIRRGKMRIFTSNWYQVRIDGVSYGYSPLEVSELQIGTRQVELIKRGQVLEFEAHIQENQVLMINDSLLRDLKFQIE